MRRGPLFLIVAGVALFAGSLFYLYFAHVTGNPGPAPVPATLAGYPLARQSQGRAAAEEIRQLHGRSFVLTQAAVGVYGGGYASVWVTGSLAAPFAASLVQDMQRKIAQGNSPFQPLGSGVTAGRTVYAASGQGQQHFYFQSGKLVIWLAVDADQAEQALAEVLAFYPK